MNNLLVSSFVDSQLTFDSSWVFHKSKVEERRRQQLGHTVCQKSLNHTTKSCLFHLFSSFFFHHQTYRKMKAASVEKRRRKSFTLATGDIVLSTRNSLCDLPNHHHCHLHQNTVCGGR